jgi:hypothetical protein
MNKIYINVFIYSLAFGVLLLYLMGDDVKKVYIYPTPDTYKDIIIKDPIEQCYQYKPTTTHCPHNISEAVIIPLYN